jgi:hypothetical protein
MRRLFLSLSLLVVSVPAVAQYIESANNRRIDNCPIIFGAQVNARANARTIEDTKKRPSAWLVDLTFAGRDQPKLVSASVTVYGLSSSNRYLPVGERWGEGKAVSQTFELHSKAELRNARVRVSEVPFVNWVELRELRFSDGKVWRLSFDSECKARLSLFRLTNAVAMTR